MFAAMPSEKRQRQDEGRLLRLEAQRAATQKVQRKRQAPHARPDHRRRGRAWPAASRSSAPTTPTTPSTTDATDTTDTTDADGRDRRAARRRRRHHRRDAVPARRRLRRAHHRPSSRRRRRASTRPRPTPPPSTTTEGDIVIELDAADRAQDRQQLRGPRPATTSTTTSPFHRIVPGFVNQAGDPVGPDARHRRSRLHDRGRAAGRPGHRLRAGHGRHGQQRSRQRRQPVLPRDRRRRAAP